ncbi:MAG TPA: GGDEF domain-containing protein [Candidatus Saccharimonadales bacterium]|nr:GGDEF domain-containing protein [Candidatus Saccharimonadales bacterium]
MTFRLVVPAGDRSTLVSGYRGVIALRWLGIALLLVSALTTPLPAWLPGSIAVAVVAGGYNLAAMELQRRGGVDRRTRFALLCADFVGCLVAMLSILSVGTGAGPAESIGLLLIGVEAVMLFDLAGFAWFCAAAPPALALAAWDQARIMNTGSYAAQWGFTWATFLLLLWLIALRGRQDSRLRAELRRLSVTDDLTLLANRRSFRTTLSTELTRSNRTQRAVCLLMLDLDHFKRVNDTFGHGAGDVALTTMGELLLSRMQRSGMDVAARVGGEEFAVILPETDEAGGAFVAERLRIDVLARAADILTTVSIGVAASVPGDDADSLLRRVDKALYTAKALGRNCVSVASDARPVAIGIA